MINTDRIVPITAIDLISMYGLILKVGGVSVTAKDAIQQTDGQFTITNSDNGNEFICSEPVKSVSAETGTGGYTMYFVPAYDYSGFIFGSPNTVTGDTVIADGRTLYKAVQSNNTVTISKIGF